MRSLQSRQFGSTNWSFIITLLILLVFVWLWWGETEKQEGNANEITRLELESNDRNIEGAALADLLEDLSSKVGWRSRSVTLMHIKRGAAGQALVISDAKTIENNFTPGRQVDGAEDGTKQPGLLDRILAAAQISFEREARLHTSKTGEEKEHTFTTLSQAFKDKLRGVNEKWKSIEFTIPVPPADPDDEQGKARYKSEMIDYEAKVKEYHTDLDDLAGTEGWAEYKRRIAAPGQWGDPTKAGLTVHFFTYTDTGDRTIETAVENLPGAFTLFGNELTANMTAATQEISQLRKDVAAKDSAVEAAKAALTKEEDAHTNDVTQLQNSLNDSNERANRLAVDKTTAENSLAKEQDDRKGVEAGLRREVEARKEENRLLKDKRDLVISRDDVDGTILASNATLATGTIDLGTKDKAFVGQKFVVSQLDRNGNRINTGEVMIVRCTGDHSSTVRIISGAAGAGSRIHNPFYQVGERISVYFAGKLDKWSKEMATERLAKLNAIVQDAPNGETHYIVVPNSWTIVKKTAAGDDDEADEEEEAGPDPLEEALKTARIFGATVITEKLFDAFLDY